jgi:hypothetical protein
MSRYTNHRHKHKPTQGNLRSNYFTFHHFTRKTKLEIHVNYTTEGLPGVHHKTRYALDSHLLHGYWLRVPLRQPAKLDDVASITPHWGGGGLG